MGKFAQFLKEQDNEKPYKLLIVSHDDPLDPNETAPLVRKKASELGLGPDEQTQTIIPDGANGIEGFILFTNLSAADNDIFIDVGVLESHFEYDIYYPTLYDARYQ